MALRPERIVAKKVRVVIPQFPDSPAEKENLLEDLERMGCGNVAELPWGLSSQAMVDEVSGAAPAPAGIDGIRAKPDTLTIEMVARAYRVENKGQGMAKSSEFAANPTVAGLFDEPGENVNKEGYNVDDIWDIRVRNVFIFLMAILYPDHKNRVFKNLAATIGGSYLGIRDTNWAVLLFETIRKQTSGIGRYNYVSPYLYHLYYSEGELTDDELTFYDEQVLKRTFGEEDTPREQSPEPEIPERSRVELKRKDSGGPSKAPIAKRTRQSLASRTMDNPAPRRSRIEEVVEGKTFLVLEKELARIKQIWEKQVQIIASLVALFPDQPLGEELPELVRKALQEGNPEEISMLKSQLGEQKLRTDELKMRLWKSQDDFKMANEKTNEQTLLLKEVLRFCEVDPEVYSKAKLMDLSSTGSSSALPSKVIGMMAEFTKRVREAQKQLGSMAGNIIKDLEMLPSRSTTTFRGVPMPSQSPAKKQELPVRKPEFKRSPSLRRPSGNPEPARNPPRNPLEDSDDDPPLIRKTRTLGIQHRVPESKESSEEKKVEVVPAAEESDDDSSDSSSSGDIVEIPRPEKRKPEKEPEPEEFQSREPESRIPEEVRTPEAVPEQAGPTAGSEPREFDMATPTTAEFAALIRQDRGEDPELAIPTPGGEFPNPGTPSGTTILLGGTPPSHGTVRGPADLTPSKRDAKKAAKKARKARRKAEAGASAGRAA